MFKMGSFIYVQKLTGCLSDLDNLLAILETKIKNEQAPYDKICYFYWFRNGHLKYNMFNSS